MSAVTLIFPHQLFDPHPALSRDRPVVLIEDTLFFGDSKAAPGRFHRQKIILHRASMKGFAAKLESRGFEVRYHDYDRRKPVDKVLANLLKNGIADFHVCEFTDFLLEKRIRCFCEKSASTTLTVHDTPLFLTPQDWADQYFDGRKKPQMGRFYEAQRKRMGILVNEHDKPSGGRWSYDNENRKPMPKKGLDIPADPSAPQCEFSKEAVAYVETNFSDYPGVASNFAYPVTHDAAEKWFEEFLTWRFDRFGPYEDAVSCRERVLFHSILTPILNIGLLTPDKVIDRAIRFASTNDIPLNSLEGFVRQIIGWREFIYVMYRRHGPGMRSANFFGNTRDIPQSFWTATTGIKPIDLTIQRVLDHSYCHHIERLMVLGNFMLLSGFHPVQVNDWFMELFIDAYDWVMVPNVFAMSQFADGGIFTTKPYISGSNYITKMSDYPRGDWCKTWDGLFWNFMITHEGFFRKQHRLGMLVRQIDKMDDAKRIGHLEAAGKFLSGL